MYIIHLETGKVIGMGKRLDSQRLRVDPRIADGYYSDVYFNRTKEILEKDGAHPVVRMQYFQKHDGVCLAGIDEALGIMKEALDDRFDELEVYALHDGDVVDGLETVMLVEGDYSLFPHLETPMLGAMARRSNVATNVYKTVKEASRYTDKPVLFFPARFDIYQAQAGDGYAYDVALRALGKNGSGGGNGVSTPAQGEWWGSKGIGTIPHALEAAYGGDVVEAALKFADHIDPSVKRVVLVDYHNDCVGTTLDVADAMLSRYKDSGCDERYKLFGVRLDTSGTMVDRSLWEQMGTFKPTGVNEQLVTNVYAALKEHAARYGRGSIEHSFYDDVGLVVSGGFGPGKIHEFEEKGLPVMAYGVGSSLFKGNIDFTADIVSMYTGEGWVHNAKTGRQYNPNDRLERVMEVEL